ncbi:rhombosortase [Psychrobium sp. MM17-31]|uniref:rhombosortase n=1 Tax=Psychrobium sp. MM17-31 TaxID=2917758 RepID=UPI001EF448E6|nr:rhombosortase [Psychrobium sp. MM17-31]MCG7530709.1 rhombosortase [Psychrobium sp. MM17-31]
MPLALILISSCLYILQPVSLPLFEFSRIAIENGELWRLFSGNLMHSNIWHLLMNLGGLFLATVLTGHLYSKKHFLLFTCVSFSLVGLFVYFFSPSTKFYVGLSGYLHGFFIYGALLGILKSYKLKLLHDKYFPLATAKNSAQFKIPQKWLSKIDFDRNTYLFLLLGLIGKIGYEQIFGASEQLSQMINIKIATDAHLYGGATAVLQFVLLLCYLRIRR